MKTIGIIGTGIMGTQLTCFFLSRGFKVIVKTHTENNTEEQIKKIGARINKYYPGGIPLNNIVITSDFKKLRDVDLVIDCIIENLTAKQELFQILEKTCSRKTIFASNTSSISINKIALPTDRLKQTVVIHFFNPVEKMHLVEINAGAITTVETIDKAVELVKSLGKTPIVMRNIPGGIVNRLLFASINEAGYMLEETGLTIKNIDAAMKLGLNHPMGLLELADFIGLDTVYNILTTFNSTIAGFKPPARIFEQMIEQGKLGRKTGSGFYEYKKE
ncbi:MAG: 3-hydroxyacyl-CoA dehydrogenase family protein [Candidatus Ratteibacteria bacterium]|nr:3-hydroxyacyl-CoA dehydrogenase family protein [Candidatus Ratteibacteria bacterium]